MYAPNYLAHYGVIGMRWGVRRYQNRDGSLTSEGRRHVGLKNESPRHKPSNARKLAKQREDNLRKAREAKEAKRVFEENKTKALEKGNATEVLKFKGHLTNQELQSAFNRINLEKQLSSIAASETKSTWDRLDSIVTKIGKVKNYTERGIEAYNTLAKIHNSFFSSDEAWKIIDGKGIDQDKKDKHKESLIRTGSADKLLKNLDKLSGKELDDAMKRINYEKKLKELAEEDKKKED